MKKWGTTKSMNNSGSFTWKPRPQGNQDTVCARPKLSTDSIISYSLCGNWCSLSEEEEIWWSMGIFATCVQQTPFLKAKAIGTSFKAAVQQFFCSMTDAYSSSNSWLEHPSKLRVVLLDPSLQMMLLIDLANLSCKQGRQEHPLLLWLMKLAGFPPPLAEQLHLGQLWTLLYFHGLQTTCTICCSTAHNTRWMMKKIKMLECHLLRLENTLSSRFKYFLTLDISLSWSWLQELKERKGRSKER